ncbi:MAG TPA: large-conductance mechanosensitive channel protein MscL [Elusimicrobiota bacterium]|nr:large-conductance mechanosensitive channel protein MscL [Elusimicrobiota bacterium]
MFKEFKAFVMRGNVVDLAVGVIIGAAFGKIISSLVNDVLMPPIGMLVGGIDFSDLVLTLKAPIGSLKPVAIHYGLFINNVIDFFIVAFCVFLVVKGVNTLYKQPQAPPPSEKECPQCMMLIPIEAKRCGHCTSTI